MIGKNLAHYEVIGLLGKGGMGEVYRARDTKLDREVALKILPPEATQNPERRRRFETEAKAVAALNHPNIVTIHSVEDAGDTHFITMELVKGRALTDLIPKSGLSLPRLLDIAIPLADAVSAAHRAGITHRDLKPENIMVDHEGRLKVLDFGLAKLNDPVPEEDAATRLQSDLGVTQEGRVLGTVAYMSPEQAEGKAVDARSDVFSLGTLLYEMSTGQRPFDGDTPVSTVTSILRDEPVSVTDLNTGLPRQLGRLLRRCLAKEPDRRYESALGLRNDLQELKAELDSGDLAVPTVQAKARAGGKLLWVVLGVILAGGIWGISRYAGGPATGSGEPAPFDSMEFTRLTTDGTSTEATISADGRYVAHVEVEDGQNSLWITQVSTRSRAEIVPASSAEIRGPSFSPDGDLVYYTQGGRFELNRPLYRKPALGGAARRLPIECQVFSMSPDGKRIAYVVGGLDLSQSLLVCDAEGSNPLVLIDQADILIVFESPPAWSADGKTIAVAMQSFDGSGIRGSIEVVTADGETTRSLQIPDVFPGGLAWLPNGDGLLALVGPIGVGAPQIWRVTYPDGVADRISNDPDGFTGLSLTADGTTICTLKTESVYHLWLVELDNPLDPVQLSKGTRSDGSEGLDWLDDTTIVYTSDVSQNWDLWTMQVDTGLPAQLTSDGDVDLQPVAINAHEFLFVSNRAGTVNVWRGSLDGPRPTQLTHGSLEVNPDMAPGADWFVYQSLPSGAIQFEKASLQGGEATVLPHGSIAGFGVVSPDGTLLAYAARFGNEEIELRVVPIDGGEPVFRMEWIDKSWRQWSPDGKEMSYVVRENGVDNVWAQPLDGGPPHQLTYFDSGEIDENWRYSPDGTRLIVSRGQSTRDVMLIREK